MSGILMALILSATSPDAFAKSFERGVEAYRAEDYAGAIAAFDQLVASQVEDPVVFFNLGNAHFRAGNYGRAIANYERTLRIDPGFLAAQDNLGLAQERVRRNLAPPLGPAWRQALLFWAENLTFQTVRLAGILLWCGFWLCLALRQWRPVPYLYGLAGVLLVASLLCGLSAWTKAHREPLSVVADEVIAVRFGPGEDETLRFELFEGDHVAVDLRQDGWARVTTVDGERGWTLDAGLASVDPPYTISPVRSAE